MRLLVYKYLLFGRDLLIDWSEGILVYGTYLMLVM
jgi:hypothetical protein